MPILRTPDERFSNLPGYAFAPHYVEKVPVYPTGKILQRATLTELSPEVVAAYDAPFPDESYKSGARQVPLLVPIAGGGHFLQEDSGGAFARVVVGFIAATQGTT